MPWLITTTETLRIHGTIKKNNITILVDGGSTHKFRTRSHSQFLGLSISHSMSFQVMVGNDKKLECTSACHQVPITLVDTLFSNDLFILPIRGAVIVLRIQWLQKLGPILTNYATLTM